MQIELSTFRLNKHNYYHFPQFSNMDILVFLLNFCLNMFSAELFKIKILNLQWNHGKAKNHSLDNSSSFAFRTFYSQWDPSLLLVIRVEHRYLCIPLV